MRRESKRVHHGVVYKIMAAKPKAPAMNGMAVCMAAPAAEVEVPVAAPAIAEVLELTAFPMEEDALASPEEIPAMALEAEAWIELSWEAPDEEAPAMAVEIDDPLVAPLVAPLVPKMVVLPIVLTTSLPPLVMVVRIGWVVMADPTAVAVAVPVTEVTKVVSVEVTTPRELLADCTLEARTDKLPPAPPAASVPEETAPEAALEAEAATLEASEVTPPNTFEAEEPPPPRALKQNCVPTWTAVAASVAEQTAAEQSRIP